jgi:late competence protein required for DNA uptake (superfamily II DNA/RNA helicase)
VIKDLANFYAGLGYQVRILTVGELLTDQLDFMIRDYLPGSKATIGPCTMPTSNSKTVFLIDEADEWVWENAANFDGMKLNGVFSLRYAARTIFLTATPTKFLKQIVNLISGGNYQLHQFKSKAEISDPRVKNNEIDTEYCSDREVMQKAVQEVIACKADSQPVLIFTEDDEANWVDYLTEVTARIPNCNFTKVLTK